MKKYSFTEAINIALDKVLSSNEKSVCIGLGINDPKRIFSTTANLLEKYGKDRIIEPPTSENALTGISFGMSLRGFSVCLIHQRFDFALLSFDQLINTISKWKFMFGKPKLKSTILIRLIVGRGWGQGPTHSQSYHSFLSSLPGVKVLYPYDPVSAYLSVLYGMQSGEPTLLIEHRWLHKSFSEVDQLKDFNFFINKLINLKSGNSFTIFTYGYMVPEALKAEEILKERGIFVDLFVTVDLSNIDVNAIKQSVKKTKNLLCIDCFTTKCSIAKDVLSDVLLELECKESLNSCEVLGVQDGHESTSFFKTREKYINYKNLVNYILKTLNKDKITFAKEEFHDIPGDWFKGPF